jgi:hypothetical protein
MAGLAGASSGGGYKSSSKGLPFHKTKDAGWFRLLPVLNHLGLSKFYFSAFAHSWYNPSDPRASKQFACPLKNKIGEHQMGTYCPACEVHAPLEREYQNAYTQLVAQGATEELAKNSLSGPRELAGKFRASWKAYAPSVSRAQGEFGWLGMSSMLIKAFENKAKFIFGEVDIGINQIINPVSGFDLHLSHPSKTTWSVEINPALPTALFLPGSDTLRAVIDKWCDDLAADLQMSQAAGVPSKVDKMHKWSSSPQEMYEAAATWAKNMGVTGPTPPSGAQTSSAPVAVPLSPATAAMAAVPSLLPPGYQPVVAQPQGVPTQVPQPAMSISGNTGSVLF